LLLFVPSVAYAAVSCTVSATSVAFGTYIGGTTSNSTGTISVNCKSAASANVSIALSTGGNGSYSPRKMSSGVNRLSYNLYSNASHTTVWGDGTGGTATVSATITISPPSTTANFTVFGQIPSQAGPAPGAYSDSIIVTVTF
jgi:spore coat protein U-like protein